MLCAAALLSVLAAAPQQPPSAAPTSLDRVKKGLEKTAEPRPDFNMPLRLPVATFKSGVEQRVFVPTFEEWLRKEFALTALQRQSAQWASQCCGVRLYGVDASNVMTTLGRAWRRRQERKVREHIARELAELEARRKKSLISPPPRTPGSDAAHAPPNRADRPLAGAPRSF